MASGIEIVNKGSDGKIKQDYAAYRDESKGRVIEVDEKKKAEQA